MANELVPIHQKKKSFEQSMGSPVMADFDDKVVRIRRDLLVFCFVAIVINTLSREFDISAISFFGLVITQKLANGINAEALLLLCINKVLLFIILYKGIYFFAHVTEYFRRYKIRLTGEFEQILDPRDHKFKDEPELKSLYQWWIKNRNYMEHYHAENAKYAEKINVLSREIIKDMGDQKTEGLSNKIEQLYLYKNSLISEIQSWNDLLIDIDVRLVRFDNGFRNYEFYQVLRIVLLEIGIPLLLFVFCLLEIFKVGI